MITEKSLVEKLTEVIETEKLNFSQKGGSLSGVFAKFIKMGLDTKSQYTLPLKDTIGRTFSEQIQFEEKKTK